MGDKKIYVSPETYPEYEPYQYVEDMKEYIDLVSRLNIVAQDRRIVGEHFCSPNCIRQ